MKEKKITFIVLGILLVGLIVSGLSTATYALYSVNSYGTNPEEYSTGLLAVEAKSKSDIISLSNALPMTDEEGLETNPYVFTIKNLGNLDYQFDVKLLSTGTEDETFPSNLIKLQINDGEVTTLSSLTDGKLNTDKVTLLAGETIDFSIRIWLSIDTTNEYINRTFDSKIVTDGQAVYTSSNNEAPKLPENLKTYITNLYLNNKDATLVERDGISYRYASSVRLMNDRQASMEVGEDAGNIRYYGKDDTTVSDDLKNYIYFNCTNYEEQSSSTCETWRIIGIVDGKVKIARNETIGNLAWDQDKNINSSLTTYTNNWDESSLRILLNGTYYDRGATEEVTYYSGSSGTTTTTVDVKTIGMKNDETRELISLSTWYLGGYSSSSGLYANDIYIHERSGLTGTIYGDNPPTTEANIGLMYASDYSYTADLSVCEKDIYNYNGDATNCKGTAWLLQSNGTNTNQWLINPRSGNSSNAWSVTSSGWATTIAVYSTGRGVRPVLYLESEAAFVDGDGSSDKPFQLAAIS